MRGSGMWYDSTDINDRNTMAKQRNKHGAAWKRTKKKKAESAASK